MIRVSLILFLLGISFSSIAQWKSHYPLGTKSKKEQENKNNKDNKKSFEINFFNGLKAKSLEDNDQALKYFAKCIKIDAKKSTPFYESAIINTNKGNHEIALEQIQKALNLAPENRWYLLLSADIFLSNYDFDNAATQYKKLITLEPGNEDLYFQLADVYIYSNDLKKAISVYDQLEEYKGPDKILLIQKHKLYRELNDIKGAITELLAILKERPNDVEVIEMLSELYLLNDEKNKAFELFKKLADIAPNNGRIHLTLADYYRENGENEKSYNELQLAFSSKALNIDTKVRILISYYQLIEINQDMKKQAYELAEILLKTHPQDLKARAVFADILYADNQYQKAKEQYLIVLEYDKTKNQVWNQVLFIQAEQNDFESMLKTSSEALEYFPIDPLFYYFNGISNNWAKNYDEAITSFKTGAKFVVDNQKLLLEFFSSLADIYHKKKQHELSDLYYEKALDIDSNNVLILNNYAYYLSLRKKALNKAKAMSFRCNKLEPGNGTYQDTYAWVLYQLKEYEEAKQWLLEALLNGGDKSPVVIEHYGDVLYKLGEITEAIYQWQKARKLGGRSQFLEQKIETGNLYE